MSAVPSFTAVSLDRRIQMLRTAMGPLIAAALEDPDVVEVMLNPDRTLWIDTICDGCSPYSIVASSSKALTITAARSASWKRTSGFASTVASHMPAAS